MSIPKCLDFEDYNNYPADDNPTTNAQMQSYLANQNDLVKQLASMVWQPNTNYEAGQVVYSSAMPNGVKAVVATAGTSGNEEPAWDSVGQYVSDSGVVWLMFDNSSEKVSKSGDTMTGNLTIKNDTVEYTDALLGNGKNKCIEFTDKNGEKIADILCGIGTTTGSNFIEFRAKDKSGTISEVLVARYNPSKERFEAYTKTMPTDDNSACIATTAYVQNNLSDYLALSGGTMSGTIITSALTGLRKNVTDSYMFIDGGTGTSSGAYIALCGKDYTNGTDTSTKGRLRLCAHDGTNSSSIYLYPNGTTQAPTPATADNSTKIATTAFVKAQNYAQIVAQSILNATPANTTTHSGYIQLGHLLICYGHYKSGQSYANVVFPKTFTKVACVLVTNDLGSTADTDTGGWGDNHVASDVKTTGFRVSQNSNAGIAWVAFGYA